MARSQLLSVAAVLFLFSSALGTPTPNFEVEGRVYCDTCRAGFETSATTYIKGSTVRLECKDRATHQLTYSIEGVTDATGTYRLPVSDDRQHEICEVVVVSSPEAGCGKAMLGRERARVLLTHNNGIVSNTRYANALAFLKDEPLPRCAELLKLYKEKEE
ncbi:hypothetical protein AMTRI_Chr10g8530 [Amborella trichopoda]|uniref:Pollen-specific protein C13 n=1 Tax=Amborella trichopoda TaxID=13333 RepID=U5DF05_AMBTC|nr:pollen-specific protein C13 [Amborella trichopoda]ERN18998.1 hypothetical protein AMTR_s00061p00032820 [Amborella trichopoda]|eukprot:XP_006857531.1 pollen-specific protein C13 [Amborella trichopoda]